ncbi:hypothetical protein WJX82_005320 [Trebouxia sp. C0006]
MASPKHLTVEKYFQYKPSLALNIVALVLFFLVTVIIAAQTIKYRSRFMWLVVFTGCLEVAGYICHLVATETVNLTAYICNLVFIIMAPNFLALANYVCVGKVAEQLHLTGRFLNTKTIASVFFIIDIICIGVQGAGSAIISSTLQNSGKASTTGGNIVLIGLAVQLLFFATFSVVTAYVYHLQRTKASNKVPFLIYVALLATILLITMRNAYRVVEIAVGWGGYLNTHEKYFYCLDALPIFVAFCIYSVLHFGKYLDAPLALRLPETTKQIIVNDSSSSVNAPTGTSASSKAKAPSQGQNNMAVSSLV